jgi:hypothetical protein
MGLLLKPEPVEARFPIQAHQPAHVTPLEGACLSVGGQILSLIGRDMELLLDQPLAAGTAVRVQARNWLMLGEVLYCVPERSRHQTRLRLAHALPSLRELTDRNRRFLNQATRAPLAGRESYSGYT